MKDSLTNQQVVVIGASSGIGLAVAKLMAAEGAKVTIASRTKERLQKAAKEIGNDVNIATIDTLDEGSVKDFFANFNNIDHLLNFSGDSMSGGVLDTDVSIARNAMESKFWGQFYVGRYGGVKIKPTGSLTFTGGSGPRPHQAIATVAANEAVRVLIESLARIVEPDYGAYCMSKGAVEVFTRTLAKELGSRNITVNALSPRWIETDLNRDFWRENPEVPGEAVRMTALGRTGTAADVAGVAAFLASPEAKFITGQIIEVSGGYYL